MESIVTRVVRRIVEWPYKRRACGRMQHIAANILRMPDIKSIWSTINYRKASDPRSSFYIEWSHNGHRQSNLVAYDGVRHYSLSTDDLMVMERDEFDRLFTLLEEQYSLGTYHKVTDVQELPKYPAIDLDTIIAADLHNSR